jgi:hypothetical protein
MINKIEIETNGKEFNFDEFVKDLKEEELLLSNSKCIICGKTKDLIFAYGIPVCNPYNDDGKIISNCKWIYAELMEHHVSYDDTRIPDVEVVNE